MSTPARMLSCALTFRDAPLRSQPLSTTFSSPDSAADEWTAVLLHEAREAMQTPLTTPPEKPYLHPVDVHTNEPGVVTDASTMNVLRAETDGIPRIPYQRAAFVAPREEAPPPHLDPAAAPPPPVVARDAASAEQEACKQLKGVLKKAQSRAAARERQQQKAEERKAAREAETKEEREARLAEAREKRALRKKAKEEASLTELSPMASSVPSPPSETLEATAPSKGIPEPPVEDVPPEEQDTSAASVWCPPTSRKKGSGGSSRHLSFYEHVLPHDRHIGALAHCGLHPNLEPALLRGDASDFVWLVDGPPGTGKTRELVRRATVLFSETPASYRLLLCAPTNVGAANLYARCLRDGSHAFQKECALCLVPERVPPGTAVLSNDARKRIVCTTVSSRSGRALHGVEFDAVFLDEAGQCMEAWTWTLLRPRVSHLVLAGDVRQLPSRVSESGAALHHGRSLLERLGTDLSYPHVTTLTVQNRMAPALLAFPNREFYGGVLTTGPYAPENGSVEVLWVADGREEGTESKCNPAEAAAACRFVHALPDADGSSTVVLLTPYASQVQALLAHRTGREVHTVDSFQGREADVVVLSVVRDGTGGLGFWGDERRPTVALTRARKRLVLVASGSAERWKAAGDGTSSIARLLGAAGK